jgi:acyl-CoA synthetase (AMP-forming)/AMP-acid ligase II
MTGGTTLVDLLARSAGRDPARDAIVAGAERVTYGALWAAVRRGASRLAERGLGRGDRVALVAPATPQAVADYYAVLAAGAVVVPLDPDLTPYELSTRLIHSDPRLVIAPESGHISRATLHTVARAVPVVDLDRLSDGTGDRRKAPRPSPEDLAAITYTSGTTDAPKGVMLTHGNLSANTLAIVDYLGLTSEDRVLSPLPIFYAYGSSVLHTHLAAGATVVLSDMVYAERTVERMADERITGFSGVPWMYATLMDRTSFPTRPLPALRYLTQAGARMSPADIARLARARPGVAFFVMYGQTEATSRLTFLPPADLGRRPDSVGRPMAGVEIEVRRADGSRAAPDESGEVMAAGPGIMAGYWRAPDLTRATISTDSRGRWLHTGDRGHLDADGYLYLDGRLSDIIKVGAHRVSPAEVEDVARLLPGVAHVAAVAAPDPLLGQVVHLVVVRAPGATLIAADLVAHCRAYLSAYKTPRHVTFADALPRTASGKLQRTRLARALIPQP